MTELETIKSQYEEQIKLLKETHHRDLEIAIEETRKTVSMIAHNTINPIVTICTASEMISELSNKGTLKAKDMFNCIEVIKRNTTRVQEITDSLQRLHIKKLNIEDFDIRHLQLWQKGISLKNNSNHSVKGDVDLLNGMFDELIKNSIKYSNHQSPAAQISSSIQDDHVYIDYIDNGPGIPSDMHEEIFQIGKRLHNDANGSGLGLAFVKKSVEQMNGIVESLPNPSGVHFRIKMKAARRAA